MSNKKRKISHKESNNSEKYRNSEERDYIQFDNTLSVNILLPKLEKLFTEQNNAIEYLV